MDLREASAVHWKTRAEAAEQELGELKAQIRSSHYLCCSMRAHAPGLKGHGCGCKVVWARDDDDRRKVLSNLVFAASLVEHPSEVLAAAVQQAERFAPHGGEARKAYTLPEADGSALPRKRKPS